MSKFNFSGWLQEMADSEIIGMIDPIKLKEIRMRDQHPLFRAYSLGHEGESRGNIIGIGNVIKTWMHGAIQMLADKITIGTRVFFGHKKGTNEHTGRTQVGELVGKALKKIKDKLHAIGIIYIDEKYRDKELDISSVEGNVDFDVIRDGIETKVNPVKINEISGIALSNSMFDKPGFPGATLQAQLQELVGDLSQKGEEKMTVDEIKKLIQQEGIIPSELFTKNELVADPIIDEHIKKEKNRAGFSGRKEGNGKVSELEKETENKISKLEKELNKERIKNIKRDASDSLKNKMEKERKLDETQMKFIEIDFEDKFNIEDPDKVDKELDSYIDARLKEFDRNLELFGLKNDDGKSKEEKDIGIKAANKAGNITDYTDPKQNEFIPI